jgi:hypothetical protein
MPADDDLILDFLERWEDARIAGHDLPVEELCRDRPDLVGVVREKIAALQAGDWMRPEPLAATMPRVLAGRYRLERLVGQGGYGQVWRAFDEELHRPVAIKVPQPARRLGARQIDQLLAEARRVARLRHPGIVPVYDVVKEGAAYFLVSDLIEGEDLARRLRRGPLPVGEGVRIATHVAHVLDYAHGQGVVHRDIKPSNILLGADGSIHVCDFGIAATQAELANGHDRRATLAYGSPEQLGDGPVDHRTDLWSLGVVLVETLTGQRPFDADDPVRLQHQILAAEPPAMPGVPERLAAVCRRCLARRPEERFGNGADVATALEAARGSRFRRLPVLLGIVGLVGTLLLLGWLKDRPQPQATGVPPSARTPPPSADRPERSADRPVAARVLSLGGRVRVRPADGRPDVEVTAPARFPAGEWHVVAVFLAGCRDVTDADLGRLAALDKLWWVDVSRTGVTHAGLAHLKSVETLELLDLEGMKLGDQSYAEVAEMRSLRVLHLGGSPVTPATLAALKGRLRLRTLGVNWVGLGDESLAVIADFAGLEELDMSGAKVTPDGVRQLRRAKSLRDVAIDGVNLSPEVVAEFGQLTQLRKIYLQADEAVARRELQRLLPKCELIPPTKPAIDRGGR